MPLRSYTDDDLARAVADSRSWRAVLGRLGLRSTSAGARRSVQRRADELGLDCTHFTGQRRWSEDDLTAAVAGSRTWQQVAVALGLSGNSSATALKAHATRLGIDFSHFDRRASAESPRMQFDSDRLPRAGGMIAATWLTLCGYDVSWPLEPCRYDLLALKDDQVLRIQVKTTRSWSQGSWRVTLSTGGRQRSSYDPDDIDYFFIVDADFDHYLIPVAVVAGLSAIHLSAYEHFRLPQPLVQPT